MIESTFPVAYFSKLNQGKCKYFYIPNIIGIVIGKIVPV